MPEKKAVGNYRLLWMANNEDMDRPARGSLPSRTGRAIVRNSGSIESNATVRCDESGYTIHAKHAIIDIIDAILESIPMKIPPCPHDVLSPKIRLVFHRIQ